MTSKSIFSTVHSQKLNYLLLVFFALNIFGKCEKTDPEPNPSDSNDPPTAISLSNNSILENQAIGTAIGTLTTEDPNSADTHSYTLVDGEGADDNANFTISTDTLITSSILDYETDSILNIRLQSQDQEGNSFEMAFTINVLDNNDPPTAISLSNNSILENQAVGTAIGTLATEDPNSADTHTYTLVDGEGADDNANFSINGNTLITSSILDYETDSIRNIRLQSQDQEGNSFEMTFTINVEYNKDAPTAISLSNNSILENQAVGTAIGTLTTEDPNSADTHSYTLVDGEGAEDNANFSINGNTLITSSILDYETDSILNIRLQSQDQEGNSFETPYSITVRDTLNLLLVDEITDDGNLNLSGPQLTISTLTVSGTTYLFVGATGDDGVSVFSVSDNGNLTPVYNLSDDSILNLDAPEELIAGTVSGNPYLFVIGSNDNGISIFSIENDGSLTSRHNINNTSAFVFDGPEGAHIASIDGKPYFFLSDIFDDDIKVFLIAEDGNLTLVDQVFDNDNTYLEGVLPVTTTVIGGTTYLFVGGDNDDGVSVFSVDGNGKLTSVYNVGDVDDIVDDHEDDEELQLNGASGLATAVVSGIPYLFVAGRDDDGISVFSIANNGSLTSVYNIADEELDQVTTLDAISISQRTYLFAAVEAETNISVFSIGDNGALTLASRIEYESFPVDIHVLVLSGQTYLLVARGGDDDAISVLRVQD